MPSLLSIEDPIYNNYKEARAAFWENTIHNKIPKLKQTYHKWAVVWESHNKLDGDTFRFCGQFETGMARLFFTKKAARAHIILRYGYIRNRPDLRADPHGWRMPKPVRVTVTVEN